MASAVISEYLISNECTMDGAGLEKNNYNPSAALDTLAPGAIKSSSA